MSARSHSRDRARNRRRWRHLSERARRRQARTKATKPINPTT